MPDQHLLLDGDLAIFDPSFGAAAVIVKPGTLTASGPATVNGKKVCVEGDEKSVSVAGCSYMAPGFASPGTGTLEIASLAGDQLATKTRSGGALVMLVGSSFTAAFVVDPASPARTGPVTDLTPRYLGTGRFVTTNTKFRGE